MKRFLPQILMFFFAIYFVYFFGKTKNIPENKNQSSNADYCSIEKNKLYSILKNSNFIYDLDKSNFLKTSFFGNSSLSLVYLKGKENIVSHSLKNLGISGQVTPNGTKFIIDVKVDKIDTNEYIFVPCCLIVTSLP